MNAGKYNRKIKIHSIAKDGKDADGFPIEIKTLVGSYWAEVKTTAGMTLIKANTDFEKAYTRFTIRYPVASITRDMRVEYGGKSYSIEYINNVDELGVELELQCVVVVK